MTDLRDQLIDVLRFVPGIYDDDITITEPTFSDKLGCEIVPWFSLISDIAGAVMADGAEVLDGSDESEPCLVLSRADFDSDEATVAAFREGLADILARAERERLGV